MYKQDLVLNNQQELIYRKIQPIYLSIYLCVCVCTRVRVCLKMVTCSCNW